MAKKKSVAAGRLESPKVTFETLPEYCRKHGFRFKEFEADENDPPSIRLYFPTEKEPFGRFLQIGDDDDIAKLVESNFERYSVVAGYVSIVDLNLGSIEARITSDRSSGDAGIGHDFKGQFPVVIERDGRRVSIQQASPALRAIHREYHRDQQYSVRISGLTIRSLEEAHQRLVEITDALFFSLELNDHISLHLVRKRSIVRQGFHREFDRLIERQNRKKLKTAFPSQKYDPVPMNLYRYGIHASGFPLLRYLAFYQVLEYYFPVCANDEAARRIQGYLKDPRFDANSLTDIAKILTVTPPNRQNEKEMLLATLRQCVDATDLYSYLTEDEDQKEWFGKPISGVTDSRLVLSKFVPETLQVEVVNRVYSIRCAIVHTKSNSVAGFLKPFSDHENELYYDTELVRYLATKVLIHRSEKLT